MRWALDLFLVLSRARDASALIGPSLLEVRILVNRTRVTIAVMCRRMIKLLERNEFFNSCLAPGSLDLKVSAHVHLGVLANPAVQLGDQS